MLMSENEKKLMKLRLILLIVALIASVALFSFVQTRASDNLATSASISEKEREENSKRAVIFEPPKFKLPSMNELWNGLGKPEVKSDDKK